MRIALLNSWIPTKSISAIVSIFSLGKGVIVYCISTAARNSCLVHNAALARNEAY